MEGSEYVCCIQMRPLGILWEMNWICVRAINQSMQEEARVQYRRGTGGFAVPSMNCGVLFCVISRGPKETDVKSNFDLNHISHVYLNDSYDSPWPKLRSGWWLCENPLFLSFDMICSCKVPKYVPESIASENYFPLSLSGREGGKESLKRLKCKCKWRGEGMKGRTFSTSPTLSTFSILS